MTAPHKRNYRPKLSSQPRKEPKIEFSTKWAEPIPNPPRVNFERFHSVKTSTYGFIDLEESLPLTISQFIAHSIRGLIRRTSFTNDNVNKISSYFKAIVLFKAAKQLYTTMTDAEKSQVQPLTGVVYEQSLVPLSVASALSMIGHFDCEFGRVYVRNAAYLFKRWIYNANYLAGKTINSRNTTAKSIWNDFASLKHLQDISRDFLDDMLKVPVTVMIG